MAFKDIRGNWKDENNINLEGKKRLKISTHKNFQGNLVTTATVAKIDGIWESHILYEDYSTRWAISSPARVTQKVVEAQHRTVMAQITSIKAAVSAFYKEKEDGKQAST